MKTSPQYSVTFTEDEEPTRPAGREYRANMLLRAWASLSPKDQKWLDRLVELMAWAKEPAQ